MSDLPDDAWAGQPVSEARLEQIRQYVRTYGLDSEKHFRVVAENMIRDLVAHLDFLERLLADADSLPDTRRSGYQDGLQEGWKMALETAAQVATDYVSTRNEQRALKAEVFISRYGGQDLDDIYRRMAAQDAPGVSRSPRP